MTRELRTTAPRVDEINSEPRFRPISDAPAQHDTFTSHQPVADALAQMIRSEEHRGKLVGLSGPWGSGKSTIVELLRNQLRSTGDAQLFVWDAWAHQGDPLRQSFLESVAEFLSSERLPWIESEKWKDRLDLLSGRKVKVETTTEKRLTFWGACIAILTIFCVPLATTFYGKYSQRPGEENATRKFLVIGIVLFLMPLVCAVLVWLWQRLRGHRNAENSFLRLLVKDPKETVITTSSKSLDPTSREFREIFVQILNDALKYRRRLVVVIDNLDRLEPEKALEVWSTLRVFFEYDEQDDPVWIARFWLLVPFDREALKRLWKGTGNESQNEAAMLVDAFIDKTFQMVFDVAPPVVVKRFEYFRDLFHFSFPEKEAQEFSDTIYRLYDRLGPVTPSPRQIKLFINKLGSLYLEGRSGVELPFLALYRLKEGQITAGASELLDANFLESRTLALLGREEWRRDWQKYLAAIHFNIPPDEALQVLNGEKIAKALESGDANEVSALVGERWFWLICDRVIWDRSTVWRQQAQLLTAATRSLSGILVAADQETAEKVWSALEGVAREIENWNPIDEDEALAAELLLDRMREKKRGYYGEICKRLAEGAARFARVNVAVQKEIEAAASWYRGTLVILRIVSKDPDTLHYSEKVRETMGAQDWVPLKFALFRSRATSEFQERFTCSMVQDVPEALATALAAGNFSPEFLRFAEELKDANSEAPWEKLNDRLRQAFETTPIPEVYASALRCAIRLNPNRATYDIGVSTDSLCEKLLQAHLSKRFEAAGLCFVPLFELALEKGFEILKQIEAVLAGPSDTIREFAKACVNLNRLELLFKEPVTTVGWSESWDAKAVATSVQTEAIRYVSAEPENGRHFPAPLFAANYGTIRRILGDSRDALDKMVISWGGRDDTVPFLVDPLALGPANAKLYANVLRVDEFPGQSAVLSSVMKDFLARTPEWLAALGNPDCEELLLQVFRLAGPAWIPAPLAHQMLQSVPRGAELEPPEPATILNDAEHFGVDGGDR